MLITDDFRQLWKPGRPWSDGAQRPAMIDLPLGLFAMGEQAEDKFVTDLERPKHRVEIAYPVAIGRYPVTVAEYAAFSGEAVSEDEARLPMAGVSWDDATAYCGWLSNMTGRAYRLPTEAEWEYASVSG